MRSSKVTYEVSLTNALGQVQGENRAAGALARELQHKALRLKELDAEIAHIHHSMRNLLGAAVPTSSTPLTQQLPNSIKQLLEQRVGLEEQRQGLTDEINRCVEDFEPLLQLERRIKRDIDQIKVVEKASRAEEDKAMKSFDDILHKVGEAVHHTVLEELFSGTDYARGYKATETRLNRINVSLQQAYRGHDLKIQAERAVSVFGPYLTENDLIDLRVVDNLIDKPEKIGNPLQRNVINAMYEPVGITAQEVRLLMFWMSGVYVVQGTIPDPERALIFEGHLRSLASCTANYLVEDWIKSRPDGFVHPMTEHFQLLDKSVQEFYRKRLNGLSSYMRDVFNNLDFTNTYLSRFIDPGVDGTYARVKRQRLTTYLLSQYLSLHKKDMASQLIPLCKKICDGNTSFISKLMPRGGSLQAYFDSVLPQLFENINTKKMQLRELSEQSRELKQERLSITAMQTKYKEQQGDLKNKISKIDRDLMHLTRNAKSALEHRTSSLVTELNRKTADREEVLGEIAKTFVISKNAGGSTGIISEFAWKRVCDFHLCSDQRLKDRLRNDSEFVQAAASYASLSDVVSVLARIVEQFPSYQQHFLGDELVDQEISHANGVEAFGRVRAGKGTCRVEGITTSSFSAKKQGGSDLGFVITHLYPKVIQR